MLEVRDIRKTFNGFTAVGGVSLAVPERGITAVIGPNGAGKSTLFNLLTGHLRADAGSVMFQGRDITARRAARDLPHGRRAARSSTPTSSASSRCSRTCRPR